MKRSGPSARSRRRAAARRAAGVAIALLCVADGAAQSRRPAPALRAYVGRSVAARVTSVVDGDTVHARLDDGTTVTVRLDGIDAPERNEPFATEARNAARVLLFDRRVQLRGTDVDRYQRLVARVVVGTLDSSVELVARGLACHFTQYSSDPGLARAQATARQQHTGFWAAGASRPRCVAATAAAPAAGSRRRRPR